MKTYKKNVVSTKDIIPDMVFVALGLFFMRRVGRVEKISKSLSNSFTLFIIMSKLITNYYYIFYYCMYIERLLTNNLYFINKFIATDILYYTICGFKNINSKTLI